MRSVAVLLTVFNRRNDTLKGLHSLYAAINNVGKGYSFDVYMTDDGSTDGTADAVSKEYPQTKILQGNGSLYWCGGMRKAWQSAIESRINYDYYLWFNDDTILYSHAIKALLNESLLHHDKSIIVGSMQFKNHSGVSYGGYVRRKIIKPSGKVIKVDYFNGNLVLVPAFVFERIGNLDSHFTHGHGDTDYGLRAGEEGIDNYVVGEYLGECDRHVKPKKCWDPAVNLKERLKNLYLPIGYPPKESFYYERKHKGWGTAMFHVITLYARVLLPGLWVKMGKYKI